MEPSATISNSTARKLDYSITWLTIKEVEKLQEQQATSVVDIKSLEGEIDHQLDG
jgi:hypothetical protein